MSAGCWLLWVWKGCEGAASGRGQDGTAVALQVWAESPRRTGGLGDTSLASWLSRTEEKTNTCR